MIQEKLGEALPKDVTRAHIALALVGVSATALVVWKWVTSRHILVKIEDAKRWRENSLVQMEKVVSKFKEKVSFFSWGTGLWRLVAERQTTLLFEMPSQRQDSFSY